ncbi:MAG TPA: N(5)-(carboxyethyl)ornithine synthase [bacterium]|nr:N(5)-(carboxyethyl)ornithine synthase [bacterium]
MQTIGFVISAKENEKRRALIPADMGSIKNSASLFFESGYGEPLGYSDSDYTKMGANISSRKEAFSQGIVCSLKAPEETEMRLFGKGQTLFGWIHAVQAKDLTDMLVNKEMTAIAWESMFKDGKHVFWRNNQLAGEAAVLHASLYAGRPLYECKVAVLGNGNAARGAISILEKLGAAITVYDIDTIGSLNGRIGSYDIIVNAVLWNVFNKDRIIYREDLKKMKPGSMIIDVSCNNAMEIETSRPTTIENPVYHVEGIAHYAVDHTPSLLWKAASISISRQIREYIDNMVEEKENDILKKATVIKKGRILDPDIIKFQRRV